MGYNMIPGNFNINIIIMTILQLCPSFIGAKEFQAANNPAEGICESAVTTVPLLYFTFYSWYLAELSLMSLSWQQVQR
jgi:hypothetical protein